MVLAEFTVCSDGVQGGWGWMMLKAEDLLGTNASALAEEDHSP